MVPIETEGRRPEAPTLLAERVTLRPLDDADIAPLTRDLAEPGVREWWVDYDEGRLREETLQDPRVTSMAIELEGELIGLIMFYEENDPSYRHASIDLTVDARHIGQGLGTEALRTVARYLFVQRGHHRITIDPSAENARAIAAYTKVGFKPVGIMRQYELGPDGLWRDGLLMDLLARELT